MGGSMGIAVGAAIVAGIRAAIKDKCPYVLFTAAGGARILSAAPIDQQTVEDLFAGRIASGAHVSFGELIGMRWVLGDEEGAEPAQGARPDVPEEVFEEMMQFIERALAPAPTQPQEGKAP